jgi:hypothetical protein
LILTWTKKLITALATAGIKHTNRFSFLGYNATFEVLNRKNGLKLTV